MTALEKFYVWIFMLAQLLFLGAAITIYGTDIDDETYERAEWAFVSAFVCHIGVVALLAKLAYGFGLPKRPLSIAAILAAFIISGILCGLTLVHASGGLALVLRRIEVLPILLMFVGAILGLDVIVIAIGYIFGHIRHRRGVDTTKEKQIGAGDTVGDS